ncbi:MAG: class I tRNA ligase family protein, partial [Syntrophales bacterium]|nr:class I tRNA ligase family protein [Syntrophales bacterium]
YRRFRNTARFMLGNLSDFDPESHWLEPGQRQELDRLALSWLAQLAERVKKAYLDYEFHLAFHRLHQFCAVEMSSLYLDILKDRLYVSRTGSLARRSAQSTLYELLRSLTLLMAPILSFTAEEVWGFLPGEDNGESVHLAAFPETPPGFPDAALLEKYDFLLKVRSEINRNLEEARKAKIVATSQEAVISIGAWGELLDKLQSYTEDIRILAQVARLEFRTITGTGTISPQKIEGLVIQVWPAPGAKCVRCWFSYPTVGQNAQHPQLCARCAQVLEE